MPVYFGAKLGFDALLGKFGFKHLREKSAEVGRVIKAVFNEIEETISGAVEVWNTSAFPDLISQIKKGWGFSIGGQISRFIKTGLKNSFGNEIMKVFGMEPSHLQLLSPEIPRGQDEAEVTDIEETLTFYPDPDGPITLIFTDPDIEVIVS